MKKRLAMLLSVAMAFSMFANVAFGAEAQLTTKDKFDALLAEGIFAGVKDKNGNVDPQLNTLTDRAQFAKILALTTGLGKEEGNSFKDKNYSKHWAKGYIEAVNKAGYMTGTAPGKFDLTGKVTGEQMAKSFALALGLKKVEGAPAVAGVSPWAYGYVAAIKEAGFDFSVDGVWNKPVQRAVLVEAAYDVKQKTSVKVESVKALDEKTIEVKFSDGETVKHTLDKALVEGQETTVEVTHKGAKHQVKVTLAALNVEAKVLGLSKVEAKFNRTVDPAKVKVEIKRGSSVLTNKEVKFDESKTAAHVELGSKMTEGEYTLTVTGATYQPITSTFKVEAERVETIELIGDKGAVDRDFDTVSIGYKVLNQYGDDITKTSNIRWNASKGFVSQEDNLLVIKNTDGKGANVGKYQLGEKISLTGIDTTNYQKSLNTVITVSEFARVDKVEFKGLYNSEKKELNTDADYSDFYVLFEAYDQYGNKLNKEKLTGAIYAATTNPGVVNVETVTHATYGQQPAIYEKMGANYDSLALRLKAPEGTTRFDGKATLNVTGLLSGKTFGFEVDVKKAPTVTRFNLLKPVEAVASEETVKIPFEAYDQNGQQITSFKALNGKLDITVSSGSVQLKQDPATKNFVVEYKAPKVGDYEQTVYIYSYIKGGTGGQSQTSFNIKKAAVPAVVTGLSTKGLNVGIGATTKLNKDNIKIQDQHGREMSLEKVINAGYTLKLTNNNSAYVTNNVDTITAKDGEIVLTGVQKGHANFTLALVKDGQTIRNSEHSFNVNVVAKDAISEYTVETLPTIADLSVVNATYKDKYHVAVKVVGKKADGSEVALNKADYNVFASIPGVSYDKASGKLSATGVDFKDKTELKGKIVVSIDAADAPAKLEQEFTVSKAAPEAKSIVIGDKAGIVTSIDKTVVTVKPTTELKVSDLLTILKVKDQYGVELAATTANFQAQITNLSKNVKANVSSGNANDVVVSSTTAGETIKAGEEFQVSFYTNGTVSQTLKVVFAD